MDERWVAGTGTTDWLSLGTVALLVVGMVTIGATVGAGCPDAAAATITIGTIQAQLADQRGQDSGTGGNNCITYAPMLAPRPRRPGDQSRTRRRPRTAPATRTDARPR